MASSHVTHRKCAALWLRPAAGLEVCDPSYQSKVLWPQLSGRTKKIRTENPTIQVVWLRVKHFQAMMFQWQTGSEATSAFYDGTPDIRGWWGGILANGGELSVLFRDPTLGGSRAVK